MDLSKNPLPATYPDCRKLQFVFGFLVVLLGMGQAWSGRFQLNSDGINYMEVGEAFWRADWHAGLNAYWSPLYPWIVGACLKLFHPSPVWEFQLVHTVDFLIYLGTFICYNFLLQELIRYHHSQANGLRAEGLALIPDSVWLMLGYTFFLLSALQMITIWRVTPDMCVAALIYLATGMIVRIHRGAATNKNYFALGTLLALGFLAKTAVLPISFIFILSSVSNQMGIKKAAQRALVAVAGLALIAGPYIFALSLHQGYPTFGETGRLAYASMVNRLPQANWQGERPGYGQPVHPTRKIFDHPAAFEFANPIPGTYPPGYDPTYWNDGVVPHFDFSQQKEVVKASLAGVFNLFFGRFECGLIAGILIIYFSSPSWRIAWRNLARQWFLLVPALAAFGTYGLVLVEPRYLGAYYAIFGTGLIAGMPLPGGPRNQKSLVTFVLQIVAVTNLILIVLTTTEVIVGAKSKPDQLEVAEYLHQSGIHQDERVAEIGCGGIVSWARLARVRITAEVPPASMWEYSQATAEVKIKVIDALFATGVRAIVSGMKQKSGCPTDWRAVGETGIFVCLARDLSSNPAATK